MNLNINCTLKMVGIVTTEEYELNDFENLIQTIMSLEIHYYHK